LHRIGEFPGSDLGGQARVAREGCRGFPQFPKTNWAVQFEEKLHNEELHNFYGSPSIIRMIKSKRIGWAWHVARMGRRGIHIGF
jgi:hypothetical protein